MNLSFGSCGGEPGEAEPPLLLDSPPCHASWTWAANCRFQSTSSMDGLKLGSFNRHRAHISIIVLSDSSEQVCWMSSATVFLRAGSSAARLACTCYQISCLTYTRPYKGRLQTDHDFITTFHYLNAFRWFPVHRVGVWELNIRNLIHIIDNKEVVFDWPTSSAISHKLDVHTV